MRSSAPHARSPSLPRPGRAASSRTASFSPLAAVLNACLRCGGARPSLRQRTAPPQTVRAPDTRRHRCHHPSGWGVGGCSGDRRVKTRLCCSTSYGGGGPRPLDRRSAGSTASHWPVRGYLSRRLCSASAWSLTRSRGDDELLRLEPLPAWMPRAVAAGGGGGECLWWSRRLTKEGRARQVLRQALKPATKARNEAVLADAARPERGSDGLRGGRRDGDAEHRSASPGAGCACKRIP